MTNYAAFFLLAIIFNLFLFNFVDMMKFSCNQAQSQI